MYNLIGALFLIVFLWLLASFISIKIYSDDCKKAGYTEAETDGFKFWSIVCSNPVEFHKKIKLIQLKEKRDYDGE